ncbi:MAG: extracellular solute-binding protein [Propionibacteriaceae bacterium]|jgi:raffinose/stachyose/melibiose transport system substrate-binding protein|nr:extracellular solute-binding protein [Propionibacteriaceae bacterium]
MKNKLAVLASAALAITLAGCSGGNGPAGDSGSGANTSTEINIWTLASANPAKDAAWDKLVKDFETANPDITVKTDSYSTDQLKESLRLATGTPSFPDAYMYWEGPGLGGELVAAGASMDITKYYDQYKWNDRFNDTVLANVTRYGGHHGVPWTIQGEGLWYNKALFKQAGITSEPKTYDELVAAADKLKAAGVTPFATAGTVNWYIMRLLDPLIETKCGAAMMDKLATTAEAWDKQTCVTEAFTELKKWGDNYFNDGYMALDTDSATDLFFRGEAAMVMEGAWFGGDVKEKGPDMMNDVGLFSFPTGTGRLYGFGEGFYVGANSTKADATVKFLDFITSAPSQKEFSGLWGAISVNKEVPPDSSNPLNAGWESIFNQATGMYLNNDQAMSLANVTEFWRIQNSVLTGDIAPDQAGAAFQQFIEANK